MILRRRSKSSRSVAVKHRPLASRRRIDGLSPKPAGRRPHGSAGRLGTDACGWLKRQRIARVAMRRPSSVAASKLNVAIRRRCKEVGGRRLRAGPRGRFCVVDDGPPGRGCDEGVHAVPDGSGSLGGRHGRYKPHRRGRFQRCGLRRSAVLRRAFARFRNRRSRRALAYGT